MGEDGQSFLVWLPLSQCQQWPDRPGLAGEQMRKDDLAIVEMELLKYFRQAGGWGTTNQKDVFIFWRQF